MKIKLCHPLISCICVTANRPQMLLKSIINFDEQDYPNKELIISYPKSDLATKAILEKLVPLLAQKIIVLERDEKLTLGAARNEAVASANGEYICVWDDDDFYYQMRIKYQYNNMQINGQYREACLITRVILYDWLKNKAYRSFPHYWPGTLLCKKELVLKVPFTDTNRGESDDLVQYLTDHHFLHYIEDFHYLYSYVYHGQNVLNYYRFIDFSKHSAVMDTDDLEWVSSRVNQRFEFTA